MIRTTVLRALVLTAALAATWTPVTCFGQSPGQDSKQLPAKEAKKLPAKATKKLPPGLLALLRQKKMPIHSPILVRVFKEEAELEVWKQDTTGRFQILKPIRFAGGRAILGRSCGRATVRPQRGSIALRPN